MRGIRCPAFVERLARAEEGNYEAQAAGMGVGVGYRGGNTFANLYIYDRGRSGLPSGATTPVARQELDSALADIQAIVRAGRYKSARVVRQFEVKDGPSTLYIGAQIAVEQAQGTAMLDSFLFVTVRGSNYVKIRYSTAAHDGSAGEAERFARAFVR